jgi:hypothetical protein
LRSSAGAGAGAGAGAVVWGNAPCRDFAGPRVGEILLLVAEMLVEAVYILVYNTRTPTKTLKATLFLFWRLCLQLRKNPIQFETLFYY